MVWVSKCKWQCKIHIKPKHLEQITDFAKFYSNSWYKTSKQNCKMKCYMCSFLTILQIQSFYLTYVTLDVTFRNTKSLYHPFINFCGFSFVLFIKKCNRSSYLKIFIMSKLLTCFLQYGLWIEMYMIV